MVELWVPILVAVLTEFVEAVEVEEVWDAWLDAVLELEVVLLVALLLRVLMFCPLNRIWTNCWPSDPNEGITIEEVWVLEVCEVGFWTINGVFWLLEVWEVGFWTTNGVVCVDVVEIVWAEEVVTVGFGKVEIIIGSVPVAVFVPVVLLL